VATFTPEQLAAIQEASSAVPEEKEQSLFSQVSDWFTGLLGQQEAASDAVTAREIPSSFTPEQLAAIESAGVASGVSDEDVSTFTDISKGVASGLLAIPQGIGELGGSVIDLIFDTDTAKSVTETFEEIRQGADLDPEGTAGKIAEALVQFGLPGLGAASAVSKLGAASRLASVGGKEAAMALAKSSPAVRAAVTAEVIKNTPKLTLRLQQIGAAAAADAVVATDGVTTLGDFFEGGPTQTDKSIGLEGREEALRRIKNKLSMGAEAAVGAAAIPAVFKTAGIVGKGAAKGVAEVAQVTGAARLAQRGLERTGRFFDNAQFSENELMQKLNETVFRHFRSRGNLPIKSYQSRVETLGDVNAEMEIASRNITQMSRIMDKYVKPKLFSVSRATSGDDLASNKIYNIVESALANETTVHGKLGQISVRDNLETLIRDELTKGGYKGGTEWVDELANATRQARGHIDDLSKRFIGMPGLASKLEDTIRENMGSYMTRVYRLHSDKNWAKHVAQKRPELITRAKEFFRADAAKTGQELSENELDDLIADILAVRPGKVTGSVDESVLSVLKGQGVLQKRTDIPQVVRDLMGEIKDPRSHYAYTISKMSNYLADRKFYKTMADDGLAKGYVYNSVDEIPRALRDQFVETSSFAKAGEDPLTKFGDLAGKWVRNDIMKEINRSSVLYNQDRGMFASLYASTFLPLKGMSQYAKTVLSPITQVRNFNTATFFAMANGNVGRGANVMQSLDTVLDAIRKRPMSDQLKYYTKMQRLGVVNTNVQVEEMRRLIDEELALGDPALFSASKLFGNLDFGRNSLMSKIRKIPGADLARDMYQGTDDLWKIYNFEFEKTKFMRAGLDEAAAELRAADIVKNTVPNYAAVPNIIKEARKLPVGNFISFPAEILRTGYNILKYSVDELASDNAAIREIGARRLMGLSAVTIGVPAAISYGAEQATGVSEEEMDAIKRYFSAPWQKNSVLIPTGRKDNGNITYIDFSYMNPYDYLARPTEAVRNAWIDGSIKDAGFAEKVFKSGISFMGELVKPFVEPSIMTEKLMSATTGTNPEGRKIWREGDTLGDKMGKGFLYMLDGVLPPFVPLDTTGAPETFARGDYAHAGRLSTAAYAALSDDEKAQYDYRGRKYELEAEMLRLFTGITEQETNIPQSLKYAGFEHGKNLASATNVFTGALTRGGYFTDEEAEQAFRTANEMRYRSFAEMHEKVKAAEMLGKSRSEVIQALKTAKVGDVGSIINGNFKPYFPGAESRRRINSMPQDALPGQRNQLPVGKLRAIYNEMLNRPLRVEPEVEVVPEAPQVVPEAAPAPQPRAAAPQQQSVTAPIPQTGGITAAPQQLPRTPATLAALGLGPMDQLIAERQAMQQPQGFAGGGPVKSGLKILGRSAAQVAQRRQLRDQIDPIKARMSELDEIIKDPSKGTARGAARLERNKLESELKPLQKQLTDLYLDKD
jgi:hypothetical protein